MKNIIKNKLFKRICLIVFVIYVAMIFINQQKTINSYNTQKKYYQAKIDEATSENKTLASEKSNLNSKEYIEKIARDKLDMYTENERVYVDINK